MTLYENYLVKNACYTCSWRRKPTGIVVHSTGACNPWIGRYVVPVDGQDHVTNSVNFMRDLLDVGYISPFHWNQWYVDPVEQRQACVNAFIGKIKGNKVATVQTLPWDLAPWGVGSGLCGSYNTTHVQFEICEDNLCDKNYFEAVMTEAIDLCAYLCNLYSIPVNKIVDHKESADCGYGCAHGDIHHWLERYGWTMDDFRAKVKQKIEEEAPMTAQEKKEFEALKAACQTLQCTCKTLQDTNCTLSDKVAKLEKSKEETYNKIEEVPKYGKETIEKLIKKGYLNGDERGLDLSKAMLRILVILDRAKVFDGEVYSCVKELPYGKELIEDLINNKAISGTGNSLELSKDMLRLLLILHKANVL